MSGHKIEIGLVPFGSIGMTVFAADLYFATRGMQAAGGIGVGTLLASGVNWRVLADLFPRVLRAYLVGEATEAFAETLKGKADTVAAVLGAPWMLTVPRGQQVQTTVELKPGLEAPIAKGAVIGKVIATANGKPVGETPLVAQADVERSGWLLLAWQHLLKLFGK